MQRIIPVECSQDTPGAYWVYGGDYHAVDITVEYPENLNELEDEQLLEMADNFQNDVIYK